MDSRLNDPTHKPDLNKTAASRAKKPRSRRSTSILSYWTLRYFLIMCAGLAVIAAVALYGIRETAMDNRSRTAAMLGQEVADRVTDADGKLEVPANLGPILDNRMRLFNINLDVCLLVTDAEGNPVFTRPQMTQEQIRQKLGLGRSGSSGPEYQMIKTPIVSGSQEIGTVYISQYRKTPAYSSHELILFASVLGIVVLSGWFTIYLLSRKLSRPIRRVAESARQIRSGRYDVDLEVESGERELGELVDSFRSMAGRLHQLEEWRALSLAGVTHELKTPVTSIKGLVMAVRDDVVAGDEAKEFLDIALKESERMERMVADLLDYNAFSSGNVAVRKDRLDLKLLVSEIVYQWKLPHEHDSIEIDYDFPEEMIYTTGDAMRIQQIVVNLLNNGMQAAHPDRPLRLLISIRERSGRIDVEIADNGAGISDKEQAYIFDRFYRGEDKKRRTRGLGLGLTYSQLLARAQGGELMLRRSGPAGTAFSLELPLL
ncbi:HAMP domain-containing sensor histidine kinase [Saccharibacillus sp. CPCC 101409]|uniref:HAMP domain-containing sensor histidine kinase n=1 Tax=Saccharibacillus sp. CPCC 101409 TaxID=3058041 RepID=UPI002670F710|nr:HAMP domain-containing sensor histidine kinase [Saccharibacillus sp. CPCC 101409]MDO3413086.1 HAMP domain-containing sensor histidine kinase [Saccharibacillus sp. CPCC 101409]